MRLIASTIAVMAGLALLVPASAEAIPRKLQFGESVEGRDLIARRIGDRDAKRVFLVVGSIHGDEDEGHEVIKRLREHDPRGVAIWLVRTVNPDGVAAGTRKNARGVDLNRNFSVGWEPSSDRSSGYYPGPHRFSEPESRAVRALTRRIEPDVTIWYHQPWNQVLGSCDGPDRIVRRYASLAQMEFDRCRGAYLPGTATRWQRRKKGRRAFVVEFAGGELSSSAAKRHERAVMRLARPSGRNRGGTIASRGRVRRPQIKQDPIPYGSTRKDQMAAYSRRHYGNREWRLKRPRQIVLHYTTTSTYQPVWNTFASNSPALGESPGVCTQFVVDKDGTIYQLVDQDVRCRHAIGVNHRTLGIELVQEASSSAEQQILNRGKQRRAAQRLVAWLLQKHGLKIAGGVIGHAMANDSPHFKDKAGWRNDHTDWPRKPVRAFRKRVRDLRDR